MFPFQSLNQDLGFFLRARSFRRTARDAHHRRPQNAPVKHIAGLQFVDNRAFRVLQSLHLLDSMVKIRIKLFADAFNSLEALFRERIPELAPDQLESFIVLGVSRIVVSGDGSIERVERRKDILD